MKYLWVLFEHNQISLEVHFQRRHCPLVVVGRLEAPLSQQPSPARLPGVGRLDLDLEFTLKLTLNCAILTLHAVSVIRDTFIRDN